MKKPNNWENTTAYGEFEPLELGGHICKIMGVEETKSQAGRDMIKISLDIAEGPQAGYYTEQFRKDNRENKRWGCIVYQLIEDNEGNASKGFKTFVKAVEKSNTGFDSDKIWDDKFASYFKGKLIGGVFGREQYKNQNGDLRWSTKCVQFRDLDTIRKGVDVPADKYLENENQPFSYGGQAAGFVATDEDDDLPF